MSTMDAAEGANAATHGPPGAKRHRRKLSKNPPRDYQKDPPHPRAASTPSDTAAAPSNRASWWTRRGKASVDLGRGREHQQSQGQQQHIGPPPRGDADTYPDTDEDDVTKWSQDLISGLSGVRARTPNQELLPRLDEGKHDHFVLASDRQSAIPSAWARQQLAASLSGRGDGVLRAKESNPNTVTAGGIGMSQSRKEEISETFHKLDGDREDFKPQAPRRKVPEEVSPISANDYLAEASGVIDDIYAPGNGDVSDKDVKREVAVIAEHQSPQPQIGKPAKILPSQHEIAIPDTTTTADTDYETNPNYYYSQAIEQSSHTRPQRPLSGGKTTIVLRYSKGPGETGQEERKSSTASSSSGRKSSSPGHLPIPQEAMARQSFLEDPSPIDPNVMAEAMASDKYEASSPETPTIATFGIAGSSPGQGPAMYESQEDAMIPRSVPEANLPVPLEPANKGEVGDLENKEERAVEGAAPAVTEETKEDLKPHRPEMHTMDTATTIDIDRRIPGSIF